METTLDLGAIFKNEEFDDEAYGAVRRLAFAGTNPLNRLRTLMAELEGQVRSGEVRKGPAATKLGLCYLALGRAEAAAEWLEQADPGPRRSFALARAYQFLGRLKDAEAEFAQAAQSGWNATACDCRRAECLIQAGQYDRAQQVIEAAADGAGGAADWHYVVGRLHEERGAVEEAVAAYEAALAADAEHAEAMFRLAYLMDLHGADQRAKELYEACAALPNVHAEVLINLAVLHEDRCEYDQAAQCLRRVLAVAPNHARARMYLKDVLAAGDMYIDEDQLKEEQSRNAVLDIPVTDFELSVRSRNCLKKMNINTLGDLLRITEAELLSYKNFGETSLREIRAMLTQKGLVLGQLVHETRATNTPAPGLASEESEANSEVLNRSVSTLQLSVRSRKCLQRLGITTIGELTARTEAELLGARNFGQTSLSEIKGYLKDLALTLRGGK